MNIQPVTDQKATLGEGPIWDQEKQQLLWVDIEGKELHIYTPKSDKLKTFPTQHRIGTVVPASGGGALLALQNGIHHMDLETGETSLLANPLEKLPDIRFNDGKCDPAGRFWVGTMHLQQKPEAAALYVMDEEQHISKVLTHVTISNGIIWSLDHKTMYYIDTPTQQVTTFDYDLTTGHIADPKAIITIPEDMGSPDGMTIDAEGMLWIALWGGGAVGRYHPGNGRLLKKIEVPALNVTACAFGGESLDTLYITTASIGMNEVQQEQYPLAGNLFSVQPGVRGVPSHAYRGLKL